MHSTVHTNGLGISQFQAEKETQLELGMCVGIGGTKSYSSWDLVESHGETLANRTVRIMRLVVGGRNWIDIRVSR